LARLPSPLRIQIVTSAGAVLGGRTVLCSLLVGRIHRLAVRYGLFG
jgi:hypothetical protein